MALSSKTDVRDDFASLLAHTVRIWRRAADRYLEPYGLTQATWLPLIHVARAASPLRQKDLAQLMALDGSSVVRLLDNLEASDLIRREETTADRRAKSIMLTRKGRPLANRVEKVIRQLQADVLGGLTDQEIEAAYTVLERICGTISAMDGGGEVE